MEYAHLLMMVADKPAQTLSPPPSLPPTPPQPTITTTNGKNRKQDNRENKLRRAIATNDASAVLEAFSALTALSSNREANYMASKTISLLANHGQWSLCKSVGMAAAAAENFFEPDTRTFTSVRV